MFVCRSRKKILKALDRVRVRICAYGGHEMCDCKYGADKKLNFPTGEVTGCPEMRCAELIIENMTVCEYNRVIKRLEKQGHSIHE